MDEKNQKIETVDYRVYESTIARLMIINKRWMIVWIITFAALFLTNAGWLYHESQFEDVVLTQTVSSDGPGNVALNGVGSGELRYYGSESDTDDQNSTEESGR